MFKINPSQASDLSLQSGFGHNILDVFFSILFCSFFGIVLRIGHIIYAHNLDVNIYHKTETELY